MKLITNLDYVTVHPPGGRPVRTMSHALLLVDPDPNLPGFGMFATHHLRGFSVTGSVPTFDYVLDCEIDDVQAGEHESGLKMLREGGELADIGSRDHLTFADGTVVLLSRSDFERDLCIEEFSHDDYGDGFWNHVEAKVAEFWTAPYMPVVSHRSADTVRAIYGELTR